MVWICAAVSLGVAADLVELHTEIDELTQRLGETARELTAKRKDAGAAKGTGEDADGTAEGIGEPWLFK